MECAPSSPLFLSALLAMLRLEGAGFWLSMAWAEPGHASLGGCRHGAQIAPTPGYVTSQLPFSSPAEAVLGAGRSPGWAGERFRRMKLLFFFSSRRHVELWEHGLWTV